MTDLTAAADFDTPSAPLLAPSATARYDRSIVEGPLGPAVWKIAWPSMLTNIVGGAQGIITTISCLRTARASGICVHT